MQDSIEAFGQLLSEFSRLRETRQSLQSWEENLRRISAHYIGGSDFVLDEAQDGEDDEDREDDEELQGDDDYDDYSYDDGHRYDYIDSEGEDNVSSWWL